MNTTHSRSPAAQSGIALLVALVMLLIITLIGMAAARTQTLEVRMAANLQDRNVAVQSGEAALRLAEGNMLQGLYSLADFDTNASGKYTFDATKTYPRYLDSATVTWGSSSTSVIAYNGPALSSAGYAQAPQFIIERLPSVCLKGCSLGATGYNTSTPPQGNVYQVTAQATGADGFSKIYLQSIIH